VGLCPDFLKSLLSVLTPTELSFTRFLLSDDVPVSLMKATGIAIVLMGLYRVNLGFK